MKKLVLLAIGAKYVHSTLSVWVLAESVSRYARVSVETDVVEATIRQSEDEIAGMVEARNPDIIGISTYVWNAGKLPGLFALLRERIPGAMLVLGGPEASHNAAYWLAQGAGHVLSGEGERSLPALLDALFGEPPAPPETEDEWIDPYNERYLKTLNGRIAYLETSRGCPFRCAFCLSGGSGVRFLPLNEAKERIRKLARSGAKTVKLVDRTFNCDAARAVELFQTVIALDTNCRFHFEAAADLFDQPTLELLQTAPPGRIQLEIGLQSYHQPALNAVNRKTDLEKAGKNVMTLLQKGNIHIHVDLIAGLPYETLAHFQNSFDKAYKLGAHTLQLGFLKLLHGSALRAQAEELGIVYNENPPYEIVSSPWLSEEDLQILKQTENALQHTTNKGRFNRTLDYALKVSGLRPFELFRKLGKAATHHGTALERYAEEIYDCFINLPGVEAEKLIENMVCDWLGMVKGKNTPAFLKRPGIKLEHKTARGETAILPSGRGVYVDGNDRDPVTGLYKLYFVNSSPSRKMDLPSFR